ncbi:MAG: peptide/nickel transport system permease protein [Thermomicrobiales bacterium]|jgi:peptide/nickel transport system permease protein|nr:peptide/nickel transport system permease protein [Thermomicrobiales bacterium]MEA2526951.1 peptide/nickel transport system permease protein [Thermomicrobiales bacterium]MEA2596959.1 peptide/nickel transport system permease protein [Thermomicrobiales bacterium]
MAEATYESLATPIRRREVREGLLRQVGRRFVRHRLALAGAIVILVFFLISALAPVIAPYDPVSDINPRARFEPPLTTGHLLGTDDLGRDVLTRLLFAGRVSLVVGFAAMVVTIVVGSLIGVLAAFYGGKVDAFLMRLTDVFLCFPTVYLLLVLAAFVTPTVVSITLIVGATAWMEVARIVRGQFLSLKEFDFVTASRALGASDARIMFRELLPNGMAPIIVAATLNVANAILAESYISFLGYGIQPPRASWGIMLNNAQDFFTRAPHLAILPGVAITLSVLAFNFVGDGLRDALDPRQRIR